jgi:hypothetical protein
MADVTSVAIGATTVGANFEKHAIANGDVGRELIVKVAKTNITDAELNTIIKEITVQGGVGASSDSFTIGGLCASSDAGSTWTDFVSGATDVVLLKLQGTGTYTPEGSNAHGVTGAVTTIEGIFAPRR